MIKDGEKCGKLGWKKKMINKLLKSLLPPTKILTHGGNTARIFFYRVCFSEQFWRIYVRGGGQWMLENKASGWIHLRSLSWFKRRAFISYRKTFKTLVRPCSSMEKMNLLLTGNSMSIFLWGTSATWGGQEVKQLSELRLQKLYFMLFSFLFFSFRLITGFQWSLQFNSDLEWHIVIAFHWLQLNHLCSSISFQS